MESIGQILSTCAKSVYQPTQKIIEVGTISDEELRRLKFAFKAVLDEKTNGNFIIDNDNRQLINDLFLYAIRAKECRYDVRKGLILAGSIGTGKTTILRAIGQFRNQLNRQGFRVWSCTTEVAPYFIQTGKLDKYTTLATDALERYYVDMGFDELGREPIPAAHYANKVNVMEQIIQSRYAFYNSPDEAQSHFTTNFTLPKLQQFYGQFVIDRLKEMCNWVSVVGTSKRR